MSIPVGQFVSIPEKVAVARPATLPRAPGPGYDGSPEAKVFSAVQKAERVAWLADVLAEDADAMRVDPASLPEADALEVYFQAMHEDDLVGVAAIFHFGFGARGGGVDGFRAAVREQRAELVAEGRPNFAGWAYLRIRDRACAFTVAPGGGRYLGEDHLASRAFVFVLDQFGGSEAGPHRLARILSTVLRPMPEDRDDAEVAGPRRRRQVHSRTRD